MIYKQGGVLSFSFFLRAVSLPPFAFGFAHVGLTCTCAVDSLWLACMHTHVVSIPTGSTMRSACIPPIKITLF